MLLCHQFTTNNYFVNITRVIIMLEFSAKLNIIISRSCLLTNKIVGLRVFVQISFFSLCQRKRV